LQNRTRENADRKAFHRYRKTSFGRMGHSKMYVTRVTALRKHVYKRPFIFERPTGLFAAIPRPLVSQNYAGE
jgi:hypothetical protein